MFSVMHVWVMTSLIPHLTHEIKHTFQFQSTRKASFLPKLLFMNTFVNHLFLEICSKTETQLLIVTMFVLQRDISPDLYP